MEIWVLFTLAAAFFQNVRSLLQKRLTAKLSPIGASYVRFIFAAPLAVLYLAGLSWNVVLPKPNLEFTGFILVGGVAQILGTISLLLAFSVRGFGVTTAFSKTEVLQTALFGFVLLAENLPLGGWLAIIISLVGVTLLSGPARLRSITWDRGVWLGIGAGAGFALSAVCYRGASLALGDHDDLLRASMTLAVVLCYQSLLMGGYFWFRNRAELIAVFKHWRQGIFVGGAGMLASVGWFTAMTMTTAALVRAVGQIELIFALITSVWFFKERMSPREWLGVSLIGIALVVLFLNGNIDIV